MTDLQLLTLLSNLQVGVHIGCCVLCFSRLERLTQPLRIFAYFLFSTLVLNYSMSLLAEVRVNNLAMTHLVVLVEFIFLSAFFRQLLPRENWLQQHYRFYLASIGGLVIANTLFVEPINTFNTNAKVLVLFVIIFWSARFFYDRLQQISETNREEKVLRQLVSGILLYYSGSFFVYLFYKFTLNNEVFYSDKMLIFNAGLYLVFTLIILTALVRVRPTANA